MGLLSPRPQLLLSHRSELNVMGSHRQVLFCLGFSSWDSCGRGRMGEWAQPSACLPFRAPACLWKPTRFHERTHCHWFKIGRCSDLIRGWAAREVGLGVGWGLRLFYPWTLLQRILGSLWWGRLLRWLSGQLHLFSVNHSWQLRTSGDLLSALWVGIVPKST